MTIDSRYFQQVIPAHEGNEYPIELEFGPKISLYFYRKQSDGTLIELPDGERVFTVYSEDDLFPIRRRGRVVLSAPIPLDEELLIVRETLIQHNFLAVDGEPFNTKEFEYVADRATLILQELEGNICMCKEPDWYDPSNPENTDPPPVDNVPPDVPACQPYACDAFKLAVIEEAESVWPAESRNGSEFPEASGGDALGFNLGSGSCPSGDPVIPSACYDSWRKGSGGTVTLPGNGAYSYSNSSSHSTGIITRILNSDMASTSRDLFRRTFNTRRDTGVGVGDSIGSVYVGQYLDSEPYIQLEVRPRALSSDITIKKTFSELGIDPFEAHWYHFDLSWSFAASPGSYTESMQGTVYVDGVQVLQLTKSDSGGSGPYYWQAAELEHTWHEGLDSDAYSNYMYHQSSTMTEAQRDTLKVAWDRNQLGYEPPAFCDELVISPG